VFWVFFWSKICSALECKKRKTTDLLVDDLLLG
jgi:hypothetical protein